MIWIALEVLGTRFMVGGRLLHQSCVARFGHRKYSRGAHLRGHCVMDGARGLEPRGRTKASLFGRCGQTNVCLGSWAVE